MITRQQVTAAAVTAGLFCGMIPARAPAADTTSGADDVVVDERTDKLIDDALKFLVAKQAPNGSWSDGRNHTAAITAYALIAFMTTGNLPDQGPYGSTVRRGLDYLLTCVRPNGYIAAPDGASNMYGHGIAAVALGEMYGTTRDESIRPKLVSAIKLIVQCQNGEGGWRYDPKPASADISVTVLQVVALRVAKNSGLDVPQATIDKAVIYMRRCNNADGGFSYQLNGGSGVARTAAAVYALQVCGLYDDPMVAKGSAYIFAKIDKDRSHYSYGVNYATPAHYMMGGDTWRRWYGQMREKFNRSAKRNGQTTYWNADGPGGDVYGTAVNISILAMPYGYLPLYQR